MPVKRELWMESLTKDHVPNWPCPACTGGYMKQKPGSLHFCETSQSLIKRHHKDWNDEWTDYRFSVLLVCNNERCKEPVAVTGTGGVQCCYWDEGDSELGAPELIENFYPEHVSPSPPLIAMSPWYPKTVTSELNQSFVASWSDFSSTGNHIRNVVERLLDHLEEPMTKPGKAGELERLSLHARIMGLANRYKDLSDSLLAVKWLGNTGSHTDELTRDDIFDALDILELILDDLFVGHRNRVKALVADINKNKGPATREVPF